MPRPTPRAKAPTNKKAEAKPPKHTVPVEEHPGYKPDGEPAKTKNGPRPQDPPQKLAQDPDLDYSAISSPDHGVLGADEEV